MSTVLGSFRSNEMALRLLVQDLEPIVPFSSLIIVEPMISPAGPQHLKNLRSILVKGAYERRDVWPNAEQAMEALKRRARTTKWDPRILDLFVVCLPRFCILNVLLRKRAEICHQATSGLNFSRSSIQRCYPCLYSRARSCAS